MKIIPREIIKISPSAKKKRKKNTKNRQKDPREIWVFILEK